MVIKKLILILLIQHATETNYIISLIKLSIQMCMVQIIIVVPIGGFNEYKMCLSWVLVVPTFIFRHHH